MQFLFRDICDILIKKCYISFIFTERSSVCESRETSFSFHSRDVAEAEIKGNTAICENIEASDINQTLGNFVFCTYTGFVVQLLCSILRAAIAYGEVWCISTIRRWIKNCSNVHPK